MSVDINMHFTRVRETKRDKKTETGLVGIQRKTRRWTKLTEKVG